MEEAVDEIIDIVKKKKIKVVTISEPNHRSYTSHTFNFHLMKKIFQETEINTFSTEKLGIFDALVLNYYLKNNLPLPEDIHKKHKYVGLGTKRWINYLKKIKKKEYHFVGAEFNPYTPYQYDKEILREFFSQSFLDSICDPLEGGGEIKVETENDRLARDSFLCIKDFYGNREKFWMLNIRRILEKYDNLFIVGFHLDKGEPIGKMIKKMYPKESLFIGSCARNIKTQILLLDNKNSSPSSFNRALERGEYREIVDDIDDWALPTRFEDTFDPDLEWDFLSTKGEEKEKIRGIGCFIAMTEKEWEVRKKVSGITTPLKNFDYIVYMRDSIYEENMFI